MLESLINPAKAERRPWEMLIVGLFYGTLSLLLVKWIFSSDPVLSKYSGILIVTFVVMFSTPFVYYTFKLEEEKDLQIKGFWKLIFEHEKAIKAFLFLFLGLLIAFSFWYIVFPSGNENFTAQIETYCMINKPSNYEQCVTDYGAGNASKATGYLTSTERLVNIFSNNIYVLIFTLIFSLIFGAGAIFILAWNASVIAAAIGIYAESNILNLPLGLLRYMIHGIPEIAAYFVGALAGGIVSCAIIKQDIKTEKFWIILQDSLNLVILSIILLFIGSIIEVFITPIIF
jgi:uncharacterized membrane protein SpoIIM required for sporulation